MKFTRLVLFVLSLGLFWVSNLSASPAVAEGANACKKPQMYFDLGNVLVDTSKRDGDGNFLDVFYRPGALTYIMELKKQKFPVGLIVNVPADWSLQDLKD